MSFEVKIPILNKEKLDSVRLWLDSKIGPHPEFWSGSFRHISNDLKWYDVFYFKYEEDKVKFILRWL